MSAQVYDDRFPFQKYIAASGYGYIVNSVVNTGKFNLGSDGDANGIVQLDFVSADYSRRLESDRVIDALMV